MCERKGRPVACQRETYVIFSALFVPSMGGVENYTLNVAQALARRGHRVVVVTSDLGNAPVCERLAGGVEVVRLPSRSLLGGRLPISKRNRAYRHLFAEFAALPVDHVIVNTRFYPHSLAGLSFARSRGVTPVLIEHGSAHLTLGNPLLDRAVALYEHGITVCVRGYDPVCYGVSRRSARWLSHFGLYSAGVLSNAIDAEAFRNRSSGRDFRAEHNIPAEAFVVSYIGRLIPEKGIEALLAAARIVKASCREGRPIVFLLAGEGPLLPAVQQCPSGRVVSLGRLAAEDVSALLSQSDAMALISRSEGFATALLECAAWGVPPVVTAVGGVEELVPTADFGAVLPDGAPETVARAVEALADDPEGARRRGSALRALVEDAFSWERTAEAVERACAAARARS